MPKADRILANLPPTFRLRGDPSALRALVDAYGGELQAAENSLVSVMRAHWVQFADAGEREIHDLALFAALYGLQPREDESVEEFREHLLRYVRSQLDSTATVLGVLRTTAEALGLHLEEAALDTWWERELRGEPLLTTTQPIGADAATLVLDLAKAVRTGAAAASGRVRGTVDLSDGVDLGGRSWLWVALDGGAPQRVELADGVPDPSSVTGQQILDALDRDLGPDGVGSLVDGRLVLTSPTAGPGSEVAVVDGENDAADLVLGLRPRTYQGTAATRARLTGTPDLSTALDLTDARYLRLAVDGSRLVEVDCAALAGDPAAVDLGEVTDAVNDAFGVAVATDDGRFLTLTSPTLGPAGSIVVLDPAAQPATTLLLGQAPRTAVGLPALSARVVSDRSIGLGVDLGSDSVLRLAIDAEPAVSVDVAGLDPGATLPQEIVTSVNEGLGATVASHDGDRVTLRSSTEGETGQLLVEEVAGDAAEAVMGLRPRSGRGAPPVTAALTGSPDLAGSVDLSARHVLVLALDGADPVAIDLRADAADPTHATLEEIARAINTALGRPDDDPVASDDGAHLVLVSPTEGEGGGLAVLPYVATSHRRFVTRARVTDDAATTLLGFTARTARGTAATSARLTGASDLSSGADLSAHRWLRVRIGAAEPLEVDVTGPRPRATTPEEIAGRVNDAFAAERPEVRRPVALSDGHAVTFQDLEAGAASHVAVEPSRSLDAREIVLGTVPDLVPEDVRGRGPAGVLLTGTVDLSAGVALPGDAALRIGVDGAGPVDVPLGEGGGPASHSLTQVAARVNLALGGPVAGHDGTHLLLTSPTTGPGSRLVLEPPSAGTDVSAEVLGVSVPRTYAGREATAARITGVVDLAAGVDLRTAHLLSLAVDGAPAVVVDLTAAIAEEDRDAVPANVVAAAVNAGSAAEAVTVPIPGGVAVRVTSPTAGPDSHLVLGIAHEGDAADLVLGGAPRTADGVAPGPAVIDGDVDLLGPVDLSDRSVLRLAIDGGEAVDVDVAGPAPAQTMLGDVVAAIDAVLPGVASPTRADRLRLTSPTTGVDSRVEVVTIRHLELQEYPPATDRVSAAVRNGALVALHNVGAAAVTGRVTLTTTHGVAGPRFADPDVGWSVRIDDAVSAGERLVVAATAAGEVVATVTELGTPRAVAAEHVHVASGEVAPLTVRRGRTRWSYTECRAARFDEAVFDTDHFAGGPCTEEAVLDLSRFAPTDVSAVLSAGGARPATARLEVVWDSHTAGSFVVNLPRELDVRFGEGLGETRFGAGDPEHIPGVVTEPSSDDDILRDRINHESRLVVVAPLTVPQVPIGWEPVTLPFRRPVPFTLGNAERPARLYLSDPGFGSRFLLLEAKAPGAWGNRISMSARLAGPAIYDLEIHFTGSRFESARSVVLGPPLPTLADDLLAPRPLGVGTGKAAGVRAAVTRDRVAGPTTSQGGPSPREEGTS